MALEDYKAIVGTVATIVTILQFMSGIEICKKIKKQGTIGDISGLPLAMGVCNAFLWFAYGNRLGDPSMMITNGTGALLQMSFLVVYVKYCTTVSSKKTIQRQIGLVLALLLAVYCYGTYSTFPQEEVTDHIGLICCLTSIAFVAAPLISVTVVCRTKSTDVLPFPLILSMFAVTGLWSLYGAIIHNRIVMYQNMIGFSISGLQLLLFLVYPKKSATKSLDQAPLIIA